MDKIKCFFECLVPVTACNLKCDYCYVIQEGRNSGKITPLKYSPAQMREIFSHQNVGGTAFFNLCGAGETLFHQEIPLLVSELINSGHYINITTNGTYTRGIDHLLNQLPSGKEDHLLVSFSLHYLELKCRNLLKIFTENIHKVQVKGCSILVQLNLYDGYIPYIDEIKDFCYNQFGALPQIAATRDEEHKQIKLHTNLTKDEYMQIGEEFDSPLFRMTMKNFNHPHADYCYAGLWSHVLDLGKGTIKACYCNGPEYDILLYYKNPSLAAPVANKCGCAYCINSSHFLSLGAIPTIFQNITYESLRNRKTANGIEWFQPAMKSLLSQKLQDDNQQLTKRMKHYYELKSIVLRVNRKIKKTITSIIHN